MSAGIWDDMLSGIGLKPGDATGPARPPPAASSSAGPSSGTSTGFHRQPAPTQARTAGPNRAGYTREGADFSREVIERKSARKVAVSAHRQRGGEPESSESGSSCVELEFLSPYRRVICA